MKQEAFEREFRHKRNLREADLAWKESADNISQEVILRQTDGSMTSRVTLSLVREQLKHCSTDGGLFFTLTLSHPMEKDGRIYRAMNCFGGQAEGSQTKGNMVLLTIDFTDSKRNANLTMAQSMDARKAESVLEKWLNQQLPDWKGWIPSQKG